MGRWDFYTLPILLGLSVQAAAQVNIRQRRRSNVELGEWDHWVLENDHQVAIKTEKGLASRPPSSLSWEQTDSNLRGNHGCHSREQRRAGDGERRDRCNGCDPGTKQGSESTATEPSAPASRLLEKRWLEERSRGEDVDELLAEEFGSTDPWENHRGAPWWRHDLDRLLEEEEDDASLVVHWEGDEEDQEEVHPLVPDFCPSDPFERYAELHHNITQGIAEQRYLVYRPYLICGMGNRMSGFQGALALSIMTDRALLVDWWGGVSGSKSTSDKYEDNFLEPNGVPHDTIPESMKNYRDQAGGEVWCQMADAVRVADECPPDRRSDGFLNNASWDEIYAAHAPVVIVQAHNQNPSYYVRDNPNPDVVQAVEDFDAMFGPDTFRLCAIRFLFRARREFKEEYCRERSGLLGGKVADIAVHIRTGDNPAYHPEWRDTLPQDVENFIECAMGLEEGLGMVAANSSGDSLGLPDALETGETVWPLGADSDSVIDLVKEGNHSVATGGKVVFIEGRDDHRVHSGSKGGAANNAGPLIDMAMLSEPMLLVGSYHSSFSFHVADIGGVPMPLRIYVTSPFAKIFGSRMGYDIEPAVKFDDFRVGCRDLIINPDLREYLRLAALASREPFIDCQGEPEG